MWESIGRRNILEFLRERRIPLPTARGQAALPPPQWTLRSAVGLAWALGSCLRLRAEGQRRRSNADAFRVRRPCRRLFGVAKIAIARFRKRALQRHLSLRRVLRLAISPECGS